jgi:regulatory protein
MAGKITALRVQQRNTQRVNVFLDGEFAFGLARITAAWLRIGQELSDEKIASLVAEDQREVAFQQVIHYLELRQRSESEIRQYLRKKGYEDAVINDTLERLNNLGLLNDEQFAQAWVENRSTFRPRSRKAMAIEMRRKGIGDEAIEQALQGITQEQEASLALQAARRLVRRLEGLEWNDYRNRLSSHLARRGFDYGTIRAIVEQTWKELSITNEK